MAPIFINQNQAVQLSKAVWRSAILNSAYHIIIFGSASARK